MTRSRFAVGAVTEAFDSTGKLHANLGAVSIGYQMKTVFQARITRRPAPARSRSRPSRAGS